MITAVYTHETTVPMQREEDARAQEIRSPGLVEMILAGETEVGSVGLCGEFEAHKKLLGGQGQGCLMVDVATGDVYFVGGLGGGGGVGYVESKTGGVILSSGSAPGTVPDIGVAVCGDASAGVDNGVGIAVCSGVVSNAGIDLGEWAIEVFGGKVNGAAVNGSGQVWVSINVPDSLGGLVPSLEEAIATLETAAR